MAEFTKEDMTRLLADIRRLRESELTEEAKGLLMSGKFGLIVFNTEHGEKDLTPTVLVATTTAAAYAATHLLYSLPKPFQSMICSATVAANALPYMSPNTATQILAKLIANVEAGDLAQSIDAGRLAEMTFDLESETKGIKTLLYDGRGGRMN